MVSVPFRYQKDKRAALKLGYVGETISHSVAASVLLVVFRAIYSYSCLLAHALTSCMPNSVSQNIFIAHHPSPALYFSVLFYILSRNILYSITRLVNSIVSIFYNLSFLIPCLCSMIVNSILCVLTFNRIINVVR